MRLLEKLLVGQDALRSWLVKAQQVRGALGGVGEPTSPRDAASPSPSRKISFIPIHQF